MIYDNEPILWLPCLNSLWIPLRALRLHYYYYSTLKTSPLLVKWRLKYHHELITYHYTQSTCMDRKEALSNFLTFYLTVSHLPSWPTSQFENRPKSRIQRCERSELRLHFKSIKNSKNGPFWPLFVNLKLAVKQCYQTGHY